MAGHQDFELAFRLILGHEGAYSDNKADPGNWTSGQIGIGQLKGTKWGISAASYPQLNIRGLQISDAHDIYRRDYWIPAGCPDMPPRLAYVVFDAAINNGVSRATRWLQTTIGTTVDGNYGPQSKNALITALIKDPGGLDILVEVHSHRLRFMAELSMWRQFRGGWSRRLVKVPLEAASYWPPG